ncbi:MULTISPECIES: hypothetical protein [Streptosporangium]|uniref:DUF222 domain-containing protein n=1 Tax=Streptosporangium brasiliense TaxID=47480 RepID=A0ABT9RER6_9ACTN|nr:hypothetical protein [Streptosporangium brasiliense]MDP9867752.1 hypothetical protein [Streptosporangium brasiliense]
MTSDPQWPGTDPLQQLHAAAAELARTAEEIREICARTTAALTAAATRSPGFPSGIHWSLLRALTNRGGLGYAFEGGRFGGPAARLGALAGRSSLATLVAVTSLRLRIAGVLHQHPELAADPVMRRLLDAVGADRDTEAVRAIRALFREKRTVRAVSDIAPIFGEVLAMRALFDDNPFNDQSGRPAAADRGPAAEPLPGLPGGATRRRDGGEGAAGTACAPHGSRWLLLLTGLAGLVIAAACLRRARRAPRG